MASDHAISRRDLLALLGLGALGARLPRTLALAAPLGAPAGSASSGSVAPVGATPFALGDVRLLDGPFRDAQARNGRYLMSLDADRLLHNFRVNAGLTPKAPVYGGWRRSRGSASGATATRSRTTSAQSR